MAEARAFWVVKGNKNYPNLRDSRNGDLRGMLEGPEQMQWATKRSIPADFEKNDGIFYWSSSPDRFIIGLGEVLNPSLGNDGEFNRFLLSFMAGPLNQNGITIDDLRETLPLCADNQQASFLRAAVAQTIYALTHAQAVCLAKIISQDEQNSLLAGDIFQRWGLS